jgi:catechol 2,3-dioxygenase-like lactoylglutathione lyase family enzyme
MRFTTMVAAAICVVACSSSDRRDERHGAWARAAAACAHEGEVSCARPILNVRDLRASFAYYRDRLGFTVDWDHGDPPTFGSVSRSHGVLFLCQGCQGTPGAWAMMFGDVDALYRDMRARNALIRMPPTDMPWGLRELHVSDPDGNVLRFGMSTDRD